MFYAAVSTENEDANEDEDGDYYEDDDDYENDDDYEKDFETEDEELLRCFWDSFETEDELFDLEKLQHYRKRRMTNKENGLSPLPQIDCQVITTPATRQKLQDLHLLKTTKKADRARKRIERTKELQKATQHMGKAAITSDQGPLGLKQSVLEAVAEWKEREGDIGVQ